MSQLMKSPSSWLFSGIKLNLTDQFRLFYFTDELHSRLECLLDKNKDRLLTLEEEAEMAGLLELDRIFSFVNAKLASDQLWQSVTSPESLSENEQNTCANTATP